MQAKMVSNANTSMVIVATNIIRFGPAGFKGTVADCRGVKAGVCSITFARAACTCVFSCA